METGGLSRLLRVEQRTRISDGGGGYEYGWETFIKQRRVKLMPRTKNERGTNDMLEGKVTYEAVFRVNRQSLQITHLMRAVDVVSGQIFNIMNDAVITQNRREVRFLMQLGDRIGVDHRPES